MSRSLTLSLTLLAAGSAYADVFSERVVLSVTDKPCANGAGYEVRLVPLFADGAPVVEDMSPYVIPHGYVLEVTDINFAAGGFQDGIMRELQVSAQNRSTNTSRTLYRHLIAPYSMRDTAFTWGATGYVEPRGARDISFSSGLLISYQARVCVNFVYNAQFLDGQNREVRLRGRLHALTSVPPASDPLPPAVVK